MLTVVTFYWQDAQRFRSYQFDHGHVRILRNMVERHLHLPHRFVCFSDEQIDGIHTLPLDWRCHRPGTCGLKLVAWRPDIGSVIGGHRLLVLDLDLVIVDAIDGIAGRAEPVVMFANPNFSIERGRAYFQGSVQLHNAGAYPEVWEGIFRPDFMSRVNHRFGGFEQAWLSEVLPWHLPVWTHADGIYGLGRLGDVGRTLNGALPDNARIVVTPGNRMPAQPELQAQHPWIREHYR